MKVCTDATLFGAMAPVTGGEKVLDIGTGTGLLALMAAQLGAGDVTGIELTQEAFDEARINFSSCSWNNRLRAVHDSIQNYSDGTQDRYDLIISNPPFFDRHSKTSDELRRQARHSDPLGHTDLLDCVNRLLRDAGLFYVLLPAHSVDRFSALALERRFYLNARTDFRGYRRNQAKVSALTFSREWQVHKYRLLTIYQSHRIYSAESERYLKPFLLRFVP